MDIQFATGQYSRDWGNFPNFRLENMFAEAAASSEMGIALQARRGITTTLTNGSGPINGLYSQNGVFDGDLFSLSGTAFYREAALLGTVTGTGPGSIAASPLELTVTAGGQGRYYDGVTLADVTFPTVFNTVSTEFMAGYHLWAREDSGRIYFGPVLDASEANEFFSAEYAPDGVLDIILVQDRLMALGNETVQPFRATGDATLPFVAIEGSVYQKGVIASGCAVEMDNTLFWIGHDGMCYRGGTVPDRISYHGIEEAIRLSANYRAFTYVYEGHTLFGITVDSGTWLYDVASALWAQFLTMGETGWQVCCAVTPGTDPFFGSSVDGTIKQFDEFTDDGEDIEKVCSAALSLDGPIVIHSLELVANTGFTEFTTGDGSDPIVEMRYSTDGHDFSDWLPSQMGTQGSYSARPLWQGLGFFDTPGMLFEFRVTQPVPFRVSAVKINDKIVGGKRG